MVAIPAGTLCGGSAVGNAEDSGLVKFDAVPIAIGIDGLQRASVAGSRSW